ncbi:MAG: FtsX-like permease family protein, partial [Pirellulales bacterium]|nr:FtsX-like permease family protein [Pirellulales bacterium]
MSANNPAPSLSLTRMIWASIRHSWRVSASVALGVATATAVIVGALLVGDSMRGSLRSLTIERLGKTDSIVAPGIFFEPERVHQDAVALILFASGVVEAQQAGEENRVRRAGSIQLIGCDDDFWDLDVSGVRPARLPTDDGVVMNQSAATELGVKVGDLVTVRLPVEQAVPADSPLGRRDIQSEGLPRMEVLDIVPDRGLGRFAISPSQAAPQNVYLSRATVADVLERDGQANTLLFDHPVTIKDLRVGLEDLGLNLQRIRQEFDQADGSPQVIYDYYSLTSDQLLLPEPVVEQVLEDFDADQVSPVITYLANAIERLDATGKVIASVPYSTITAINSTPELPLDFGSPQELADATAVHLVLNQWAADRLNAEAGTQLRVAYYEPEVENGQEVERYFDAVVTAIVPITEPAKEYTRRKKAVFDQPPTVYNDPDLTPTVPGVTDQASISDWDLPFPLKRKIDDEDDQYWNQYRLTPKAFLPLADGRRLFGSRFGQTTSLRITKDAAEDVEQLRQRLDRIFEPRLADLGWVVRPLRQQQLAASRGTTPFDVLFLALSFFVILAAVMLIAMLFRLGMVERLRQFGTLLAIGWPPQRVGTLARREGLLVAALGVVLGLAGGAAYAVLVLWALRHWWVGAVTVPFLTFHWTPLSLAIGAISGWLVAGMTLLWTARSLLKVGTQSLLSGRDSDVQVVARKTSGGPAGLSKISWAALGILVLAVGIAASGAVLDG